MKKITQEELNELIERHWHYLRRDVENWKTMRLVLNNYDLSYSDLSYSDLSGSDLSYSDLSYSNLSCSNLSCSDLSYSDLKGSNLTYSNLSCSNLICSDLSYGNLGRSNLRGSDLRGSNLKNVFYDHHTSFFALQCPEEGSFIGYKKASDKIIKLEICEDAKRSSSTSRKCRCSKAKVLSITNLDGTASEVTKVASKYDENFIYEVGKVVEVTDFDEDRWNECSSGIHFFITREEAVNYE